MGYLSPTVLATEAEIEEARRHLMAWLRWWMQNPKNQCETQLALAKALHVTGPAVTYWLQAGSTRMPSGETLLSIRKLLKINLDVLLNTDPPL